ncbi:MAG: type I methionyl aminopeptidase [Phycisphaerae bacterium]|jgi:methionyl aminopeptidase
MAITLKTPTQVARIARAGRVLDTVIDDLALRELRPGRTTAEVGAVAEKMILARGGELLLKGYTQAGIATPFPSGVCICVNEEVVHAPPSSRIIREGDLVTIDVALRVGGWCIDTAWSVPIVGSDASKAQRAVKLAGAATATLRHALSKCRGGVKWSAVAESTAAFARSRGCHLVSGYCGHGIGEALHEAPRLAFTSKDWSRSGEDFTLYPGMVLCVEPIVCEGVEPAGLITLDDAWTVITTNRAWAAHEERCIEVTRTGCRVLAGEGSLG